MDKFSGIASAAPATEGLTGENRDQAKVMPMTTKNKKRFGVWMDNHHATIVGYETPDATEFSILGHAENPEPDNNSNENSSNHQEKALTQRYFKEIGNLMMNAEEVHLTGTGTIQEQFTHYLADTPRFKNVVTTDSTSNRMGDVALLAFVSEKFH